MKHFLALFLLSAFTVNAAVVTITAPAKVVTVTAGGAAPGYVASEATASTGSTGSSDTAGSTGSTGSTESTGNTASTGNTSSTDSTGSQSSSGTDKALITEDEFMSAWKAAIPIIDPNAPTPTHDQFQAMVKNAGPNGGITSRQELAMFFAEIMHESGGLQYKKELNPPAGAYGTGAPGKQYYGRGYIQLSWPDNYKKASAALFGEGNTSLYDDPDQVATNEDLAWGVSFYYWKAVVKPTIASNPQAFGLATKAINGPLECNGGNTEIAKKRFKIYTAILKVWEPNMQPVETGCYN